MAYSFYLFTAFDAVVERHSEYYVDRTLWDQFGVLVKQNDKYGGTIRSSLAWLDERAINYVIRHRLTRWNSKFMVHCFVIDIFRKADAVLFRMAHDLPRTLKAAVDG